MPLPQTSQPRPAQATKTLRQPLEYRPRISEWLATTQALFNQVAAFYWDVLDAHPGVLDLPARETLTALDRLTYATADHPHPTIPLDEVASQMPAYFRRAAIHAALGAMRGCQTRLARWRRAKAKAEARGKPGRMRPPVPPREWHRAVVLYAGRDCGKTRRRAASRSSSTTGRPGAGCAPDTLGQPDPMAGSGAACTWCARAGTADGARAGGCMSALPVTCPVLRR
jgi:hypothetical protein